MVTIGTVAGGEGATAIGGGGGVGSAGGGSFERSPT
jgi:hypothetical protein